MDQLIFASLSHTHYWYEVGMLKVPAGTNTVNCYCCCCCCFLTLTDPLRIQPWSQDRRNQTKSNRESEISMESRQKRTDKEVASKEHRRDKIENMNKNIQTVETN